MKLKTLIAVLVVIAAPSVVHAYRLGCGIPPIPPIGCRVGPCVCDANGDNCHYEFICG